MAAEGLQLEIATPKELAVSQEVSSVTVPGAEGEFGVLPNHTPFLTPIRPGKLSYEFSGGREELAVGWGYAEVRPNKVLILTEFAERRSEIDAEKIRAEIQELSGKLQQAGLSPEETESIRKQMERLQARLKLF